MRPGLRVLSRRGRDAPVTVGRLPALRKQNAPAFDRGVWQTSRDLEQVPQELVVDLVVELDFLRFDESAQRARTTIRGGLFQVGITALTSSPSSVVIHSAL